MIDAIRYNLANLTNFAGRDSRSTFWFYVLFLFLVQMAFSFAMSILFVGGMVADTVHAARTGTEGVAIERHVFVRMAGVMRITMWTSVVTSLAMTGLLVAAFTRRLHDSDKPGWIAAITAAAQLIAILLTISMIDPMVAFIQTMKPENPAAMQAAMQAQQAKFALNGALGWVPLLLVVVFGVWPSTDGDNRYGPEPDHL